MDESISRAAAIDALNECRERTERPEEFAGLKIAVGVMRALPPAQPEIIRCKDCKYYRTEDCYVHIERLWELKPTDYCSQAERD